MSAESLSSLLVAAAISTGDLKTREKELFLYGAFNLVEEESVEMMN